jgi:aminoglycoside phosphotransferase (APT) family kinase protein|tara:strand:- start:255 stop:1319 length:1065 start_codon:yes stop_codon:yes gene_type:complete
MTNELHQPDENTGTMEVLERHQFDVSNLKDYMHEHVEGFEGDIKVEEFKGGQSNPTYKIVTPGQSYVLRRKPPGKLLKSAHAVDREYAVITALNQTDVPVPKSYALCEDDDVIGTAFYLMEFKDGRVLWDPAMETSDAEEARGVYESMNDSMAKLHSVDPDAVGLSEFGKPGNYVGRQVSRWSKQYIDSETETIESMNNLIEWLPNNLPAEKKTGIVHGDYSLTNVMIGKNDPNVIAILDWELSTLGDPCADFNYHCLQYTMNAKLADKEYCKAQGIPVIDDYVKMYSEKINIDLTEEWDLYSAYNLFKLAGILQGILGRVRDGTAAHENAAERASGVKNLSDTAWALVEKNFI